ncbi:MAG: hypothetical protein H7126_18790, partial [Candidatus Parcubacteria bacterium]|nr:hypothetical protein [Leptolyngbyaceae cyanobacterium LF-bin-113]
MNPSHPSDDASPMISLRRVLTSLKSYRFAAIGAFVSLLLLTVANAI